MKKKLLVGILVLTMLVACLGVSALATSASTMSEDEFKAALATGEVTLEGDVTLTEPVEITNDVTINLNGHTISGAKNYTGTYEDDGKSAPAWSGLLAINGGSSKISVTINGTGSIKYTGEKLERTIGEEKIEITNPMVINANNADLTLDKGVEIDIGEITHANNNGNGIVTVNIGSLTVTDATITVPSGSKATALSGGLLRLTKLTVKGGKFNGSQIGSSWAAGSSITGGTFSYGTFGVSHIGKLLDVTAYTVKPDYDQKTESIVPLESGNEATLEAKAGTYNGSVDFLVRLATPGTNYAGTITVKENATLAFADGKGDDEVVTANNSYAFTVSKDKTLTVKVSDAKAMEVVNNGEGEIVSDGVTCAAGYEKTLVGDKGSFKIGKADVTKVADVTLLINGEEVTYEGLSASALDNMLVTQTLSVNIVKIKLLEDVELNNTINVVNIYKEEEDADKPDLTIDLNGKTLTYTGTNCAIMNNSSGRVDVISSAENGKLTTSNKVVAISVGVTAMGNPVEENYDKHGEAVIGKDVTINGTVGVFNKGSKLTVEGTINVEEGFAIAGNGTQDATTGDNHGGTEVVIEDGAVVKSGDTAAVYQPQDGTLTVKGGEIEGAAGIVARAGSVTVEDGATVTATAEGPLTVGDSKTTVPASAVVVDKTTGYGEEEAVPEVQINGGEFHAAEGQQTVTYTEDGAGETEGSEFEYAPSIEVSGGTFQSNGKADETVNQYTVAEKAINENTGTVYNYDNEIIAFGYGATRQEAIESAKTARKGTKGEPAATLWDTLDWIDQTFYIVFDEPVPAHKSIDVTVSFAIDGEDYTFTATCNGGDAGTSRMFAWSFLNNDQNTVVGPDGEETTISGTPTGNYTLTVDDSIDLNGHGTVAVEAAEGIVLEALIAGETAEEKTEKNMTVSVENSDLLGQYYEASFATENLEATKQNGTGSKTYYLGWAMSAPDDATKFDYRMAASAEDLVDAPWTTGQNLETNITGAGNEDTGLAVYYDAANIASAKTWVQVRFTDGTHNYGTYIVHVVMDEVTFAPMVDVEELDTKVTAATLKDTTGADGEVANNYTVKSTWNAEDRVVEVVIDARNVKLHANANNQFGYWVGFTVAAPENAAKIKGDVKADRADIDYAADEPDEQTGPISFYLNAGNEAFKTTGMYYELQWLDAQGNVLETITYHVTIAQTATVDEPDVPTLYGAITTENAGTDKNNFAGTELPVELKVDSEHGYYYEVTLDPGKLYESTSSDAGQTSAGAKYYTGFAILAPAGVDKDAGVIADFANLTLPEAGALSENVVPDNTGKGEAFYFTVDQDESGNLKLNKEWAKLAWYNAEGKVVATYTFHVVLSEDTTLQVTGVDASIYEFGFTATDGDKAINDALTAVLGEKTERSDDAGTNVVYAVIKADVTGTTEQKLKLFVTDSQNATDKLELANPFTFKGEADKAVTSAGYLAFSFDNATQTTGHSGGLYTAILQVEKTSDNFLTVASKELAIYKITYMADTATAENEDGDVTVYVLAEDLDSALETVPSGFTAKEGNAVRVKGTEAASGNEYNITVTVEGYTRTVSGGGASATTSKVTTPENGSVELSSTTARGGQTVTVTATPDEGYDIGDVIVKDRNGNPVEVTKNDDGTYSYTVPAGKTPVTVEVVFDECLCDDFADLDLDEWYHEAVDYAIKSELMLGQGDGWHPTDAVRGAEIFVILGRLDGAGLETGGDHWYDESLAWAMEKGYTDGSTPLANCSRERAVTLLWRYYGEQESDADITGFIDAADVSDWALDAMKWAVENEIIKGLDNNDIQPKKDLTRAEFATILERLEAAPATETAE